MSDGQILFDAYYFEQILIGIGLVLVVISSSTFLLMLVSYIFERGISFSARRHRAIHAYLEVLKLEKEKTKLDLLRGSVLEFDPLSADFAINYDDESATKMCQYCHGLVIDYHNERSVKHDDNCPVLELRKRLQAVTPERGTTL